MFAKEHRLRKSLKREKKRIERILLEASAKTIQKRIGFFKVLAKLSKVYSHFDTFVILFRRLIMLQMFYTKGSLVKSLY